MPPRSQTRTWLASAEANAARRSSRLRITAPAVILFLSMLPVTMLVPVLKEIVGQRFAVSEFWTHSFMWFNMVGAIVAAATLASLSDRLPRRRPVLIAALFFDGLLIWGMTLDIPFAVFLVLRTFEGAAHIVAISTLMAAGADLAGTQRRGRTMGLLGGAMMMGTTIGAPLGGILGNEHPLMALKIGAAFSLIAAFIAWLALPAVDARPQSRRWADVTRLLREHQQLWFPYAYAFIDRLCVGVIVSSFVLFLTDRYGLAPAQKGGLLACFMLPFAVLCYPVGRFTERGGRAWAMCIGSIGFGCVYAIYGIVPASWLAGLMVCSGILSAIMFAPNLAICADLAPADKRSAAFGGLNMAGSLGFLVGPLLGGIICGPFASALSLADPYPVLFPLIGATEVLCALVTLPWVIRYARDIAPKDG